jgi:hypothetical protein
VQEVVLEKRWHSPIDARDEHLFGCARVEFIDENGGGAGVRFKECGLTASCNSKLLDV